MHHLRKNSLQTTLVIFITLGFVLRALVPQGFMWGQKSDQFVFSFCNGGGTDLVQVFDPQSGTLGPAQSHHSATDDDDKSHDGLLCPSSVSALAMVSTLFAGAQQFSRNLAPVGEHSPGHSTTDHGYTTLPRGPPRPQQA